MNVTTIWFQEHEDYGSADYQEVSQVASLVTTLATLWNCSKVLTRVYTHMIMTAFSYLAGRFTRGLSLIHLVLTFPYHYWMSICPEYTGCELIDSLLNSLIYGVGAGCGGHFVLWLVSKFYSWWTGVPHYWDVIHGLTPVADRPRPRQVVLVQVNLYN